MWLSKQMKPSISTTDAELGTTTIAGEQAGVMTRGEVRDLPICSPGGYAWLPENGSKVLVVRGGSRRRGTVRSGDAAGAGSPRLGPRRDLSPQRRWLCHLSP